MGRKLLGKNNQSYMLAQEKLGFKKRHPKDFIFFVFIVFVI